MDPVAPKPDEPGGKRSLSRRAMLAVSAAAVVVAALPFTLRSRKDHVRSVLKEQFGDKVVTGEAADRFIADVAEILTPPDGLTNKVKTWMVIHFGGLAPFDYNRAAMEDTIVTLFLKRTNAWRRYTGRDQELEYFGLDPYQVGCANFLNAMHME